jgi:hypothetical protein
MHDAAFEESEQLYRGYFPEGISISWMVKAVDRCYSIPENVLIPVTGALRVSTLRFEGTDPAIIENFNLGMRQAVMKDSSTKAAEPK